MLWYKLKTWYGGEEELVKEIRRTVPPYMYDDVFVIYNERNLRRQQQSMIQRETLFKGNVFLTCRDTRSLFERLEKIPAVWHLILIGHLSMIPLQEKDARFLEMISDPDHVVRISYVLRESAESSTYHVCGPLEYLLNGIEKIRFSSRFAKTHKTLWGEDTVIPLGILTNEDMGREIFYYGQKILSEPPNTNHYMPLEIIKDKEGKNIYRCHESITILPKTVKSQIDIISQENTVTAIPMKTAG